MKDTNVKFNCNSKKILKRKIARRKRQIRTAFTVMITIFIMLIGISAFSLKANANSSEHANACRCYKNYCIEPGDSLWSIAEANMDYEHYDNVKEYALEIQHINKISGEKIMNGTHIMIPYYTE